jgi:hypothetical protein
MSALKRYASRVNARASTGPRTAAGKARSRRNAFRHGLSLSVLADPALASEVDALAQKILGEDNVNVELRQLAHRIAEAQIDLIRVRQVRDDMLERALRRHNDPSLQFPLSPQQIAVGLARRWGSDKPLPLGFMRKIWKEIDRDMFGPTLPDSIPLLKTLDRYERRVLSRRKFAVREFDAKTRKIMDQRV